MNLVNFADYVDVNRCVVTFRTDKTCFSSAQMQRLTFVSDWPVIKHAIRRCNDAIRASFPAIGGDSVEISNCCKDVVRLSRKHPNNDKFEIRIFTDDASDLSHTKCNLICYQYCLHRAYIMVKTYHQYDESITK